MNQQSPKEQRLQSGKISMLLFSLAMPAICAQIVTLLYNLVDRIYIGRMEDGALAMAGVGICAPIVTIVTAFTGLFGRGGSPLAAISMGKKNNKEAEKFLGNSFSMLVISSLLVTVCVLIFKEPLLRLFGASDNTIAYADEYLSIYCIGTVFVQLTVGMNYYITTQGFAREAMLTTMIGGILNIIFDPIFMFAMNMGISGAALATVLSQLVSFIWVMFFLLGKRTILKLHFRNFKPDLSILKRIVILGASPFFMSASEGVLHICFNNQVLKYGGDTAVGAMTILFSMFQFLLLPVEGVAQGSQPIIGYNYGAGEFKRVRDTISLAIKITLSITMIGTGVIVLFPEMFIRIFNGDPELVAVGGNMLRVYIFGCFILGANSTFQQTYNSLGEGKSSFFFAFYRKIILLIPLLFILPALFPWGVMAVVLAEPISDTITTVTNAIYFRHFLKKKLPLDNDKKPQREMGG